MPILAVIIAILISGNAFAHRGRPNLAGARTLERRPFVDRSPRGVHFPRIIFHNYSTDQKTKSEKTFPIQRLKVFRKQVLPQFEYLLPEYGLTFFETGVLWNLRFHGNPEDPMVAWIKTLFPSPNGATLTPSLNPHDPVFYLKASTLGKIIKSIQTQHSYKKLKNEVTDILFQDLDPEKYVNRLVNQLRDDTANLKRLEKNLLYVKNPVSKKKMEEEVGDLRQTLVRIKEELPRPQVKRLSFRGWRRGHLNVISSRLVNALKLTQMPNPPYPRHFVEQTLMAFAWAKKLSIEEYKKLFAEIPEVLERSENSDHSADFFEMKDFRRWTEKNKGRALQEVSRELLADPSQAVFYGYSQAAVSESYLKPSSHTFVTRFLRPGVQISFTNCVENLLLNFLNIVLFNPALGKVDESFLVDLAAKFQLQVEDSLFTFFSKHNEAFALGSESAQLDWVNEVISKLEGSEAVFLSGEPNQPPVCNLKAKLENALYALEILLFKNDPAYVGKSIEDKLNRICEVFSRYSFQLSWKLERSEINTRDSEVVFFVNEVPTFRWLFTTIEESIRTTRLDVTPKKNEITAQEDFAPSLLSEFASVPPVRYPILAWYFKQGQQKSAVQALSTRSKAEAMIASLFFRVKTDLDKLELVESIFRLKLEHHYELAFQLIETLPSLEDFSYWTTYWQKYFEILLQYRNIKPLGPICERAELRVAQFLVDKEKKEKIIFESIESGRVHLLKWLISQGVDIENSARFSGEFNSFQYAIYIGNIEIVKLIGERLSPQDMKTRTASFLENPFHIAARRNFPEISQYLYEKLGRTLSTNLFQEKNSSGFLPVDVAISYGANENLIQMLCEGVAEHLRAKPFTKEPQNWF